MVRSIGPFVETPLDGTLLTMVNNVLDIQIDAAQAALAALQRNDTAAAITAYEQAAAKIQAIRDRVSERGK